MTSSKTPFRQHPWFKRRLPDFNVLTEEEDGGIITVWPNAAWRAVHFITSTKIGTFTQRVARKEGIEIDDSGVKRVAGMFSKGSAFLAAKTATASKAARAEAEVAQRYETACQAALDEARGDEWGAEEEAEFRKRWINDNRNDPFSAAFIEPEPEPVSESESDSSTSSDEELTKKQKAARARRAAAAAKKRAADKKKASQRSQTKAAPTTAPPKFPPSKPVTVSASALAAVGQPPAKKARIA